VRKRHRITVIRCRTRHPPGSPVLITRTQHHDADGTLLQYAETITPARN
jgi:DNA-binding GntR family transcriptional regulator